MDIVLTLSSTFNFFLLFRLVIFIPMIIGEIKRYLRDNSPIRVSRSLKDISYKAMQAKEQLTNKLNREPTIEQIAEELQMEKKDVVMALEAIVSPVSLYEPVYSDGGDTIFVMDQISSKEDDSSWIDEISIKESIRNLSDREKRIVDLRFF
jgi:RNA polymerase sporulation-specific sigma factor